jgi:hypothetical protein
VIIDSNVCAIIHSLSSVIVAANEFLAQYFESLTCRINHGNKRHRSLTLTALKSSDGNPVSASLHNFPQALNKRENMSRIFCFVRFRTSHLLRGAARR